MVKNVGVYKGRMNSAGQLWQPCSQFVCGELRSQSGIGVGSYAGTVVASALPFKE